LRVITGKYKGRKLESPFGQDTRPTTDKVKEAVFDMIAPWIPDAVCVDLFAGTGALGIEALSRGAERCLFCDHDRSAAALVRKNIAKCGDDAVRRSTVREADHRRLLSSIKGKADVFFLDPPYGRGIIPDCLERIEELDLLSDEGIIVAEHEKYDDLPERVGSLGIYRSRRYGKTMVTIYAHLDEEIAE